ncbi:helix-turn-helix domain-containing protein [Aquimarina rhabdastrellae]
MGIPKPKHPLITLVRHKDVDWTHITHKNLIWNFYQITLKYHNAELHYGRQNYDFEEGSLIFTAPNQVISTGEAPTEIDEKAWGLLFHPDLIRNTELGQKIHQYSFFNYEANEALHLSEVEEKTILEIVAKIEHEYSQNLDQHSQTLIVTNLELLLNYCLRFYDRQFYTRTHKNKSIVAQLETLLLDYVNDNSRLQLGIPTVSYCAEQINISPNYLSDLLKKETGKTTKEYIDYFLIEKAKTMLVSTKNTVTEIAYDLGFESSQYFSKLFKKKTGLTPVKYRNSVN